MATRFISRETDAIHYNPSYHGKVFTRKGICDILCKHGLPGEQWRYDPRRKFDYFIEVQLWNQSCIDKLLSGNILDI